MLRSLSRILLKPTPPKAFFIRPFHDFKQLAADYKSVGALGVKNAQDKAATEIGSGVYLGDRWVLTAAHCVAGAPEDYFFSGDIKPNWHKVDRIYIHPRYKYKQSGFRDDLAILQLKTTPAELNKAEVSYEEFAKQLDCVAVGYPRLFARRSEIGNPEFSEYLNYTKIAVKVPDCYLNDTRQFEHKIGYVSQSDGTFHRQKFDALDSGTFPQMSGGGLFKQKKLIGLVVSATDHAAERAAPAGVLNQFTPLFDHAGWIKNTIEKTTPVEESPSHRPEASQVKISSGPR